MRANNNHIDIRTIELYVKGKLTTEQKQSIDLLRAADPFLDAAISGYEQVPDSFAGYKKLDKRFASKIHWGWNIGFVLLMIMIAASLYWLLKPEASSSSILLPQHKYTDSSLTVVAIPHDSLTTKSQESKTLPVYPKKQVTDVLGRNEPVQKDSLPTLEKETEEVRTTPTVETTLKETVKGEEVSTNILPAKPSTQLDVAVYYGYTREYILNAYLALTNGSKKSTTQKGRDELVRMKLYLQNGQLKKAMAMVSAYTAYDKGHAISMNEWIDILSMVENKDYQAARVRLKELNMNIPLRMVTICNQLRAALN